MKKQILLLSALALTFAGCVGSPAQTGQRASENKRAMVRV